MTTSNQTGFSFDLFPEMTAEVDALYGKQAKQSVLGAVVAEAASQQSEYVPYLDNEIRDFLLNELASAQQGCNAMIASINECRLPEDWLESVSITDGVNELETWVTPKKVAYVVAAQEADPGLQFTLVATPNVAVTALELIKVAEDFALSKSLHKSTYNALIHKYSDIELSGTKPYKHNKLQFSLIPNSLMIHDAPSTGAQLRTDLSELQVEWPFLKVPSVLEAITYWQTLVVKGDPLEGNDIYARTHVYHFDLPERIVNGRLNILESYIDADFLNLTDSTLDSVRAARLAVG